MNFVKGEFQVKSTSNSNQLHLVQISTASCICESWNKYQYPCKYFFAVFATCQEWSFFPLPEDRRNCAFSTLDTDNLGVDEPTTKTEDGPQSNSLCGSRGDNSEASEEINAEMSDLKEHPSPPKHGNQLHGQTTAPSL